jgi:hypothetical protein
VRLIFLLPIFLFYGCSESSGEDSATAGLETKAKVERNHKDATYDFGVPETVIREPYPWEASN